MAKTRTFAANRLIMGTLSVEPGLLDELIPLLEELFGPVYERSDAHLFTYSDYYQKEMGGQAWRSYLSFKPLIDPSALASIKIQTNELEERWLNENGGRRINLDPGLLSLNSIILATAKGRTHRVPLREGIWADLTLIWDKGRFVALPWTYADYRDEETCSLFTAWRETLKQELSPSS